MPSYSRAVSILQTCDLIKWAGPQIKRNKYAALCEERFCVWRPMLETVWWSAKFVEPASSTPTPGTSSPCTHFLEVEDAACYSLLLVFSHFPLCVNIRGIDFNIAHPHPQLPVEWERKGPLAMEGHCHNVVISGFVGFLLTRAGCDLWVEIKSNYSMWLNSILPFP